MRLRKRCTAIFLALVMAVPGALAEGTVLETKAAPETRENAYIGFMLTKEEFQKFSYTEAEAEWSEYVPGENENGLANYEARYVADGKTLNEVLGKLKDRDKFFWQEGEDDYRVVSGDDVAKADEGYYAVFADAQGLTAQNVTNLDGVNGVLFDTHYYNDLEDGAEPDEHTQWHPYTYEQLTVEAKTALTFRGCYSDITVKYGAYSKDSDGKEYPVVMRAEAAGSVRGAADAGGTSSLYLKNARVYGISGFDKMLFLPCQWRDEESGEEGIYRSMDFNSPTGKEEISFGSICSAGINENGEPQEIEGEEGTSGVDLNIWYHDGYIPKISGNTHLGVWHEKNEETGETETGNYAVGLNYYSDMNDGEFGSPHKFTSGDQVVDYGSAQGWSSFVWYNAPESDGEYVEYRIDAQGCLYRELDRMFRVNRYRDKEEYDAYYENGQWAEAEVGESATISGALRALAYDSELNPDNAYYTLALIQDWDNRAEADRFWEADLSSLFVPEKVKGLRLTAEGWDTENVFRRITGILDEVTVKTGTELELTGWYRAKNGNINISGGGTVAFADAKVNGNVRAADGKVSSRGQTAVKSLTGMKALELSGDLTVENELRFAENGQINVTKERENAHILARSGAKIEIPNLNCVYDTEHQYGNLLEIYEEVKDKTYPVVIFSGERILGDQYWETYYMNYQVDAEEADENGQKPEHMAVYPMYRYVPLDKDGNENWEESESDLIILNDKVYKIEWDHESQNGTDKITLDDVPCTLLYQRLAETDYTAAEIQKCTYDNEVQLFPYDASAVSKAAEGRDDIGLYKDPYTDDSYGIDVWDEWNCEYHEDETAEYFLSGITDLTRIAVGYGKWEGEGSERHYEGRGLWLYSIQEYVLEKEEDDNTFTDKDVYTDENGVRKYALFYPGEPSVKSSHYVSDSVPNLDPVSLADTSLVQVTVNAHVYSGSAISEKPVVTRISDSYILQEGKDYTLSYQNHTNAGTASVTITAIEGSGFTGQRTADFTIKPKSAASLKVSGVSSRYYYTGGKIKPAVTVYDGSKKLTLNDYSVSYSKNTNIGKAKITITGKGNYTGTLAKDFTITVKKNASYTVGGCNYKILNAATNGKGTVSVTGLQKNTVGKIKIADTAAIGGVKFKVTSIGKNAFKNCRKATDATIGNNVTDVGDNAFSGCTALTKVTIGKSVKTIGKSAFEKDSKLKTIKVQSTVLKKVGKNALKGIHKKAVISVPKKQLKSYKKLLKGKGQASSVKVK